MADVSVRAEARKALAQFARLYPKEQRGQVVDIVSAYGVRCILNEVALEQLSPARLAEACEEPALCHTWHLSNLLVSATSHVMHGPVAAFFSSCCFQDSHCSAAMARLASRH